jgi:hypothetical protein
MMRRPVSRAAVACTLLRHDMPLAEVRAVLGASDPATVRRYLELHRERLEERFVDGRRALATLERSLVDRLGTTACANGSS